MKIIYLTWGEPPQHSGIYGSQVVRQLKRIQEEIPDSEIVLVSGLPIIFGALIRQKWEYINELKKVKLELGEIEYKIITLFTMSNLFFSNKKEFKFFHVIADKHLSKFVKYFLPDILHCRSYHATYAAIQARKYSGLDYKIVFDARGLWPEEGVVLGRRQYNDPDYIEAKKIEKYLLDEADVTVCVSDTMKAHYESVGVKQSETIYLSSPVKSLKPNIATNTSSEKNRTTTTLCYVGLLARNTWHLPQVLFDIYRRYRECVENPHLLIVTQSNHKAILEDCGDINLTEIELTNSYTPQELAACLHRSAFGILPYFIPSTPCEHLVAETVIASKTAEYLAAGLPVLVNKYCGGAREIIIHTGLGLVYDPEKMHDITRENLNRLLNPETSQQAVSFAEENFSYEVNAKKYHDLYVKLLAH